MIAAGGIKVTRVERSKLNSLSLENIPFGKYFTDHMLEADFENGEWKSIEIKPFQPLLMSPSTAALHYGQAIFEGIKAYKNPTGEAMIFRPFDNFKRFNISAERMEMPQIPEEIFMEGLKELVRLDSSWIPPRPNHSLYIRPLMFSTDEMIGVKPSDTYKFLIMLSPTGPYYSKPMRIYVEEKYVRAVPGGVGYAKNAGNYGAAMFPTAEAKRKGFDQVLWMDAFAHKYVQECGTMNVFFIIGDKAITPDLFSETILAGVTRDSVIQILEDMGFTVEQRNLSIDEIVDHFHAGNLKEIFGTGTAATISIIQELKYRDFSMEFDPGKCVVAKKIKEQMDGIKQGMLPDAHHWMTKL
ncbi:MAG: branched-chain amino acid aminotransferase [Ginsengibacter sp.]